jgi:hypothetical protein
MVAMTSWMAPGFGALFSLVMEGSKRRKNYNRNKVLLKRLKLPVKPYFPITYDASPVRKAGSVVKPVSVHESGGKFR